jgi:hypothetical protein
MSITNTFLGTTIDGVFVPDEPAAYARAHARKDGTRVVHTVKRFVARRTDKMNAYWWGCVIPLFQEEMGLDNKDDVHDEVLIAIGHWEWREVFGEQKRKPRPTRNLPEDEFMQLVEKAERLFSEYFGGRVPPKDSKQAAAMMAGA